MEEIRSFISIELPEPVRSHLAELQRLLRQSGNLPVKWVRPESIHLTLKFLGNVASSRVPELSEAISKAVDGFGPIDLKIGAPGAFPNARSPRVVWVGLEGQTDELSRLQASVERALNPLGFPPEKRSFAPHLTLGRVRDQARPDERRRLGEAVAGLDAGAATGFRADSVNLMKSVLAIEGAIYTCLSTATLTGR